MSTAPDPKIQYVSHTESLNFSLTDQISHRDLLNKPKSELTYVPSNSRSLLHDDNHFHDTFEPLPPLSL